MEMRKLTPVFVVMMVVAVLGSPRDAQAYIGPGVGISAIGTLLAFVGAIVFAIIGFLWYPMKRLLVAVKARSGNRGEAEKASVS
jgi:hypothetical protein